MVEAVRDAKLVIPIGSKLPLSQSAEAQTAAEKGGIGKGHEGKIGDEKGCARNQPRFETK
jgi:hypothetical protein